MGAERTLVEQQYQQLVESVGLPMLILFVVIALCLLYLGLRAQKNRPESGQDTMIGQTGIVVEGRKFRSRYSVEIRGERWWCRSDYELKPGMEVKVTEVSDMVLDVEPV